MYREWKYSCGVSCMCEVLLGAVGNSVSGSVVWCLERVSPVAACVGCPWVALGQLLFLGGNDKQTSSGQACHSFHTLSHMLDIIFLVGCGMSHSCRIWRLAFPVLVECSCWDPCALGFGHVVSGHQSW